MKKESKNFWYVCFVTCKEGRYVLYNVYKKVCNKWKTNKIATRSGAIHENLIFLA